MNFLIKILYLLILFKVKVNSYELEDLSCIRGVENRCHQSNQLCSSNNLDLNTFFPKKYSKTNLYSFDGQIKHLDESLDLNIGDIIQCEIVEKDSDEDNDSGQINVTTTHSNDHTYFVAPLERCFSFKVRASKTAIIGLSGNPMRSNSIIEFVIQSVGNSYVRKGSKFEIVTQVSLPNVIDVGEYRGFWIKWTLDGVVEIGRDADVLPFLTYKEPNMFPINYIGIHTWENPGSWILNFEDCPGKNSIKNQFTDTKCLKLPTKDKISMFANSVRLQKELLDQMKLDHSNFKKSVRRSKSYLDGTLKELQKNFKYCEELHNKIFFSDVDDDDDVTRDKYLKEKIFEQIKDIFYDFVEDLDQELNKIENGKQF